MLMPPPPQPYPMRMTTNVSPLSQTLMKLLKFQFCLTSVWFCCIYIQTTKKRTRRYTTVNYLILRSFLRKLFTTWQFLFSMAPSQQRTNNSNKQRINYLIIADRTFKIHDHIQLFEGHLYFNRKNTLSNNQMITIIVQVEYQVR